MIVPEQMKQLKNWVVWNAGSKIPINPVTGTNAKSNDPGTWSAFDVALEAVQKGLYTGVGFMFGSGIVGIDIDHCIDDNGILSECATDIITQINSYTEYSQSGRGIHIFCIGAIPEGANRNSKTGVEIYAHERYFAMTGNIFSNFININTSTGALSNVYGKYVLDINASSCEDNNTIYGKSTFIDINDLMAKATVSKNGEKFKELFGGHMKYYNNDHSAADQALCNILAFWTNRDIDQMDQIFRLSGLMRDKWDELRGKETYGQITLKNAIKDCLEVYTPPNRSSAVEDFGDNKPWLYETSTGLKKINADILAKAISETLDYIILRKKGTESELTYVYENGVYNRCTRNELKYYIKDYIPLGLATDNLLNNVYNLLLCSQNNTYDFELANNNENIINLKNGLYDLRTRQLKPHNSAELSTLQLNCSYVNPYNQPVTWIKFINDLCTKENGVVDQGQVGIFQEWTGLILSNIYAYRTKKCLALYSPIGNTGKSAYLGVINQLLGVENSINVPIQKMSKQFAIGNIYGKRSICIGDQQTNDIEDSSVFKQLTGGDPVEIEFKGKQSFNYIFKGGIMFSCNNLPGFKDDKGGHIFERLLLMPCTNVIPVELRDGKLVDKIMQEKDSIFMWALEGLHRLIDNSFTFTYSSSVNDLMMEYRKDIDTLYRFINENCILTENKIDKILKTDFENKYTFWCSQNGYNYLHKNSIKLRAEKIGLGYGKVMGYWYYKGVKYSTEVFGDNKGC